MWRPGPLWTRKASPSLSPWNSVSSSRAAKGTPKKRRPLPGRSPLFARPGFGLGTGKKVTRALIRLEKEELAFQFTLKAEDFTLGSLKTPKVEKPEEDDDPDAMLLEKIYLMEVCLGLLDSLYARFLQLRLSPQWQQEVADMRQWMTRTE